MRPAQKTRFVHHVRVNGAKVMEDFQKSDQSSSHRNATFKIDAPFEKARYPILKVKPEPRKRRTKG
jgi:hypothetical protein